MHIHRTSTENQLLGDLAVCKTLGDKTQNLHLPFRQSRVLGLVGSSRAQVFLNLLTNLLHFLRDIVHEVPRQEITCNPIRFNKVFEPGRPLMCFD